MSKSPNQAVDSIAVGLPDEYIAGLRHYAGGDYFAAHEAWEARWQRRDAPEDERIFLQALIQSAVIFHLLHLGRPLAAQRMYRLATEKFTRLNRENFMGLAVADYQRRLSVSLAWLKDARQSLARPCRRQPRPGLAGSMPRLRDHTCRRWRSSTAV